MAELQIPSRRRQPKDHLRDAARSELGSDIERYGIQAAIAEALIDIHGELYLIRTALEALAAK